MQVDGEPWTQPAGQVVVLRSALKVYIVVCKDIYISLVQFYTLVSIFKVILENYQQRKAVFKKTADFLT